MQRFHTRVGLRLAPITEQRHLLWQEHSCTTGAVTWLQNLLCILALEGGSGESWDNTAFYSSITNSNPAHPSNDAFLPLLHGLTEIFWVAYSISLTANKYHIKNALVILINCPHYWQHQRRSKTESAKEGEIFSNCKGGTEAHGRKSLSYFYTETVSAACANTTSTLSKFLRKNNLNLIKKKKNQQMFEKTA